MSMCVTSCCIHHCMVTSFATATTIAVTNGYSAQLRKDTQLHRVDAEFLRRFRIPGRVHVLSSLCLLLLQPRACNSSSLVLL